MIGRLHTSTRSTAMEKSLKPRKEVSNIAAFIRFSFLFLSLSSFLRSRENKSRQLTIPLQRKDGHFHPHDRLHLRSIRTALSCRICLLITQSLNQSLNQSFSHTIKKKERKNADNGLFHTNSSIAVNHVNLVSRSSARPGRKRIPQENADQEETKRSSVSTALCIVLLPFPSVFPSRVTLIQSHALTENASLVLILSALPVVLLDALKINLPAVKFDQISSLISALPIPIPPSNVSCKTDRLSKPLAMDLPSHVLLLLLLAASILFPIKRQRPQLQHVRILFGNASISLFIATTPF